MRCALKQGEHPDRWKCSRWEDRQEQRHRGQKIQGASVGLQRRVCGGQRRKVGPEAESRLLGRRWTWSVARPRLGVTSSGVSFPASGSGSGSKL